MAMRWDEAVAFALALPGVELAPHYGVPAPKVRGKAFCFRSREPGSFAVAVTLDEVEMLIATDPATFWQSPHWEGWAGILVREDAADPECVTALVERAWERRASKGQKAERAVRRH